MSSETRLLGLFRVQCGKNPKIQNVELMTTIIHVWYSERLLWATCYVRRWLSPHKRQAYKRVMPLRIHKKRSTNLLYVKVKATNCHLTHARTHAPKNKLNTTITTKYQPKSLYYCATDGLRWLSKVNKHRISRQMLSKQNKNKTQPNHIKSKIKSQKSHSKLFDCVYLDLFTVSHQPVPQVSVERCHLYATFLIEKNKSRAERDKMSKATAGERGEQRKKT